VNPQNKPNAIALAFARYASHNELKTQRSRMKFVAAIVASFHEAGHFVAADHFSSAIDCRLFLGRNGDGRRHSGSCRFVPASNWVSAVVGWAGVIAENAAWVAFEEQAVAIRRKKPTYSEWLALLPARDRKFVNRHSMKRRAGRFAHKILKERWNEVHEIAAALIRDGIYRARE
jgi:hypothetical protein